MSVPGKVFLVGAGPGDPELLSLKAYRILQDAEVVIYDALLDKSFQDIFPEGAEKLFAGKRCGNHHLKQQEINQLLVQKALEGKRVVRLKGGDPFIFGRGGEELLELRAHGIECEVIPGITALSAAGASTLIPATHRKSSDHVFITYARRILRSPQIIDPQNFHGTLAVYMGAGRLQEVAECLIKRGFRGDTPVALIENASLKNEKCSRFTLSEAAENGERLSDGPGIIVVGKNVNVLQPEQQINPEEK